MESSQGPVSKPPPIPPRIPHRPDLPQEEREQLAAEWLERCHQAATPERIAELAPYTPEFPKESVYARLADELVRNRVSPSNTKLKRLFMKKGRLHQKQAKRRKRRRAESPVFEPTEEQASDVAHWVNEYRERNGEGPTWSEVQAHFEWTSLQTSSVIRTLKADHWLDFGLERRSLRAGECLFHGNRR
ncbi:hypothetical protein FEF26_12730 [Nesterenkonia salmonea]|uniref:Uncharacterized protein n=1 Tax=Nesterenkonia salmonea TaxID=1804987 RepID=A0A5R9B845_9MICC|nr:hypothetical protein [Nesterenkonia salmonea]TLP93891.1 hypothetical protein FEF26_12730 [Nesterenkonia salmonea]